MKIGIVGKGNVGRALGVGLTRAGHQMKFGHRDPKEPILDAAEWGEVVILAVPYSVVTLNRGYLILFSLETRFYGCGLVQNFRLFIQRKRL